MNKKTDIITPFATLLFSALVISLININHPSSVEFNILKESLPPILFFYFIMKTTRYLLLGIYEQNEAEKNIDTWKKSRFKKKNPDSNGWIRNTGNKPLVNCPLYVQYRDGTAGPVDAETCNWDIEMNDGDIFEWLPDYVHIRDEETPWIGNIGKQPFFLGKVHVLLRSGEIKSNLAITEVRWDDVNIVSWTPSFSTTV